MESINHIRNLIIETGKKLVEEGYVTRTWGNISIRIDENNMLITPSGRTYDDLTEKDIVLVNYHTLKHEGNIKPSSEKEVHCEIYKSRKDINAVIHTHQMNASTVATARREIPAILDDQAQIIGPSIKVAPYTLAGTKKIAKRVVKALRGRNAALMANHGAVCIGRDIDEAFVVCQLLEKTCKAFIEAEFLGGAKNINKFQAILMHRHYIKNYSKQALKNK
ncbi:MAG: class II aldolase/adducin family protein [Chloroflexia bacterium]|nr:class II aldolase/adducin family protein [Chloroflexia bacterium]